MHYSYFNDNDKKLDKNYTALIVCCTSKQHCLTIALEALLKNTKKIKQPRRIPLTSYTRATQCERIRLGAYIIVGVEKLFRIINCHSAREHSHFVITKKQKKKKEKSSSEKNQHTATITRRVVKHAGRCRRRRRARRARYSPADNSSGADQDDDATLAGFLSISHALIFSQHQQRLFTAITISRFSLPFALYDANFFPLV